MDAGGGIELTCELLTTHKEKVQEALILHRSIKWFDNRQKDCASVSILVSSEAVKQCVDLSLS